MYEIFAVAGGILSALLIQRFIAVQFRTILLITCSVLVGAVASFASGELFVSWIFLLVDTALAFIGAVATVAFLIWLREPSR